MGKLGIRGLVLGFSVAALVSCGSARNDQGVSFTLLGAFSETPGADACASIPSGVSGMTIPLASLSGEGASGDDAAGGLLLYLGVQNNLSDQFLRTVEARFDYEVPGASAQPPSTTLPFQTLVGPFISTNTDAGTTGGTGFDSSLPGSFGDDSACNRAYGQTLVLPGSVRSWIALNKASLPDTPFTMIITITVNGVTNAGKTFESNDVSIPVVVVSDNQLNGSSA